MCLQQLTRVEELVRQEIMMAGLVHMHVLAIICMTNDCCGMNN